MSQINLMWIIKYLFDNVKTILFFTICWYLGINTFRLGYSHLDFSKPDEMKPIFLILSGVGILLFLLPFFTRVKIGEFEIEREIAQTKKELSEFKDEARSSLSFLSTQITTVSNIKNSVTVHVLGGAEAEKEIKEKTPPVVAEEAEVIRDELALDILPFNMSVVELRIQVEYWLRRILEKTVDVQDASIHRQYMSLPQMIKRFINLYPDYQYLQKSFDFIREVGNAAAHAQQISDYQAKEAVFIGSSLIATLKDIAERGN